MRAFIVSVQYTDLLSVTLPYNRHHFTEVTVITSQLDAHNILPICGRYDAQMYITNSFYDDGAIFNKWKALEEALDNLGRKGWICLLDADILWPKVAPLPILESGKLYCPMRRMFEDTSRAIPDEDQWRNYPIHPNVNEYAGYSQIFHGTDYHLGNPPWHETDWIHAGGADSFFQMKWEPHNKIRPPFEVLHLGKAGINWYGRATDYLDGSKPEGAERKLEQIYNMWSGRRGRSGPDRFKDEKIS